MNVLGTTKGYNTNENETPGLVFMIRKIFWSATVVWTVWITSDFYPAVLTIVKESENVSDKTNQKESKFCAFSTILATSHTKADGQSGLHALCRLVLAALWAKSRQLLGLFQNCDHSIFPDSRCPWTTRGAEKTVGCGLKNKRKWLISNQKICVLHNRITFSDGRMLERRGHGLLHGWYNFWYCAALYSKVSSHAKTSYRCLQKDIGLFF